MSMDLFEDLLNKQSIFRDERKLDINFIPNKLPHRNKELSLLSQLFLTLLTNPNEISRKILITGKTGIGKTVTVKLFGEMLIQAAKKRQIAINYIHVNCRKERTSYKVLIKILRSINTNFPKRGYSPQDLLEIINDFLNLHNIHILVVLDELNYLINNDNDLIYSLTRLNDDSFNLPQRFSIIGIVRDISCINNLDNSTLSTLQRNIIKFDNYTNDQIFDILKYRAEISLKENILPNDRIEMISDMVSMNGDIRYGLNLIWKAGKIAENKNLQCITSECIRLATEDMVPFSTLDILKDMTSQKLMFLFAIVSQIKNNKLGKVTFLEILKSYLIFCENTGLSPRSYSQLWNYLQEYKKEKFVLVKLQSKSIKGRKALIEIPEIPLNKFENTIKDILNSKGLKL
ncbi:MAG: ORC1-type DNA replication protein [Promethearchaeota archaeon]|nr:MAG: ORC1-type DNA replication protein [Candidatus Lokiarchaeota archaeon]